MSSHANSNAPNSLRPPIQSGGAEAAAGKLEETAADVLSGALRRADVANPDELARSIAPMVVAALRSEIAGVQDAPGKSRAASGARRLAATFGAQLNSLLSVKFWRLRMLSLLTGLPLQEILLDQERRPALRSILALERDSGKLIAKWRPEGVAAELMSNLTAAIKQFSLKELSAPQGDMRVMNFRSSRIFLRSSARLIIAAEFAGEPHPDDKVRTDRGLKALIRKDAPDDRDLARVAAEFAAPSLKPGVAHKWILGCALAAAALLAVFALLAFFSRNPPMERRLQEALAVERATQPQLLGWPLALSIDNDKHVAELSGVAPPDANLDALAKTLAAATPYRLDMHVTSVETAASAAAAAATASERAAALADQVRTEQARLEKLEARFQAAEKWLTEKQAEADTPAVRLARLAQTTVILFGDDDNFLDSDIAHRQLAALAAALKAGGGSLRVVGHTDSHGSAVKNRALSKARADAVIDVLEAEGIRGQRLVAAGRADDAPIAVEDGAERRRNRRVTFDLLETPDGAP